MSDQIKSADDMVAEADTGARNPDGFQGRLIIAICIIWSLFQLYIASKVPGVIAQATGVNMFANIVAQARYVHLAFAIVLATMAFPLFKNSPRDRIPAYDWALLGLAWRPVCIWSCSGFRSRIGPGFGTAPISPCRRLA